MFKNFFRGLDVFKRAPKPKAEDYGVALISLDKGDTWRLLDSTSPASQALINASTGKCTEGEGVIISTQLASVCRTNAV